MTPLEFGLTKAAYSVNETLSVLSIGRTSLYDELSSGRLRSFLLCGRRLVLHEDLVAWLGAARSGELGPS